MTTRFTTLMLAGALLCAAIAPAAAQQKPPLSPPAKASVTIGAATITIDYAQPSMRGRKIMGELVPYDKVWRTGANAATTLKTTAALEIGGTLVPAGTYTLYTLPGEKGWKLIINKQTGQWGLEYKPEMDLGRVDLKLEDLPSVVEQFTIKIVPTGNTGMLRLEWDKTAASVSFMVH